MDGEVDWEEPLACFAVEGSKMKTDGVHWRGFMPSLDDGVLRRSVFRTLDLTHAQKVAIGNSVAAERPGKTLHGWGEVCAYEVTGVALRNVKREPPDRHVDIEGWSDERVKQEEAAKHLASIQRPSRP